MENSIVAELDELIARDGEQERCFAKMDVQKNSIVVRVMESNTFRMLFDCTLSRAANERMVRAVKTAVQGILTAYGAQDMEGGEQ